MLKIYEIKIDMKKSTLGTLYLDSLKIKYSVLTYEYEKDVDKIGLYAAKALNKDPDCVFKTLMIDIDNQPVCVVLPCNHEVAMKKLASVCNGKSAHMIKPPIAEKLTGYKVGGISPFGQKKKLNTIIDETAILFDEIYINGGARGLIISISPNDAQIACNAIFADITN